MEKEKVVEKFLSFLEDYYKEKILVAVTEGKSSMEIDFREIEKYDVEVADYILENPDEFLKEVESSLGELDATLVEKRLHLRFFNLPEDRNIRIRNLRAEHVGKLVVVDGIVKRASEVRPEVYEITFQCPSCGELINIKQEARVLKAPEVCPNCGNKKGFKQVAEKFYDTRWIVIEEPFEITSGERPSDLIVHLKEDLVTPKMQYRTDPGNRIKVTGVLRQLPRRVRGSISKQMEIYLDAIYVESVETEWEEIEITEEDEKKIIELAKDPQIYDKIVASIAPTIYGLEDVKLAIALQLFGGEEHIQKDKSRVRGEIHILLIGDPSCIVGDERVVLSNGAIVKIENLGSHHLQSINVPLYLAEGYKIGIAKVFHKYEFQPIIEIITESGKSIKGTFNQPLLVKENVKSEFGKQKPKVWKRLDEIKIGDEVRVINWIPCKIKKYVEIWWEDKEVGNEKIKVPKVLDEKLAAILGYLLSDGYVRKYKVGCVFKYNELDLLPKFKQMFFESFGIESKQYYKKEKGVTNVEIVFESLPLSEILSFLKEKRIPDIIFRSKNSVVASFLSWLYDGKGSVISYGRGRNGILYKSKEIELLRDIQILLLRFGINASIYGNNLIIRQPDSIERFSKYIGFNSERKKKKLQELLEKIKNYKKRRHRKRWERVVKIIYHPPETVYDVEVPVYHKFVANGIVCHNTAKSQLMKIASTLIPRARYVSGKGITGVGITASVVRDEELFGGWVLEAGALVLCNKSLLSIDEFEKIDKQDMTALHEAMEMGQISIAKANIVATLPARTSILAGGNPKFGRFDPYLPIKEQIEVPETILSRFDLKFALRDVPNPEIDEKVITHLIQVRHLDGKTAEPPIPAELFRKYVAYARKNCHPKLIQEAAEEIKKFFLNLRSKYVEGSPVSITFRQYEALIRLAEASAKVQLRNEVTKEDALRAIKLMSISLRQLGFEPKTETIDIDRLEGARATAMQRSKIRTVISIIEDMEKTYGKEIPFDEILKRGKASGIEDIEDILRKMQQEGVIYSPRPGFISRV
jgi:DNA replicative helicase MCM subunit Mcm2 (Cdc46/Mcm family)